MWRKETRWHSFSREHSGVKLFSQRASCRQLRVRSRATCSRVWNLWLLGSSGDHRMGGRAGGHRCLPDGDQSWNGDCRGYRAGRAQRQRLQAEFWGRSARLRFRSGHSWADRQVSKTGLGVLPVLWPSPPLCSVLGRQTRSTALQSVSVPCPVEGAQKILQACFQRHRLDLLPSSADLNVRFLGVSHCPCSAFWTPSGCGSPRAGKLYQRVFADTLVSLLVKEQESRMLGRSSQEKKTWRFWKFCESSRETQKLEVPGLGKKISGPKEHWKLASSFTISPLEGQVSVWPLEFRVSLTLLSVLDATSAIIRCRFPHTFLCY